MKKRFKIRDFNNIKLRIIDDVELPTVSTRTLTDEGYLKAVAAVTKVGVQMYPASQFGLNSDEAIGVFRPPETVFHPETISSLKMKPIVLMHPEQDVDSTNHSRLAVGSVGENVSPIDSGRLGASIQITDEAVVKNILSREIEELSLGYDTFVVSESGDFNGQKYLYRMDGPMINNHLAIVPEGRCGDSVKILDQGEETVNWKKFLKILRDANVSEARIKVLMADAKETDAVDMGTVAEALKEVKTVKDIDMTALVPALVAELKPELEAMVKTPEFTGALAKEIAASMSGSAPAGEGDLGDADPEGEELTPEMMDAAINDKAMIRSKLIDKAMPFVGSDKTFDIYKAKNRDILEKSLLAVGVKAEDMKDRSDDYLTGLLDSVSEDRAKSAKFMNTNNDNGSSQGLSKPMTGIDARKSLK